jgi:hypothetical protein
MGADCGTESPLRSNFEARGYFYTRMTEADLRPVDFVAGLKNIGTVEYVEGGAAGGLVHAEIPVPADAGSGYCALTRIGSGLLVIVDDYSLQKPREEMIQDGGLIQLNFRLSGEVALARVGSGTVHCSGPGLFMAAHPRGNTSTRVVACTSRDRGVTLVVTPRFLEDEFLNPCISGGSLLRELASRPITSPRFQRVPLSGIMLHAVTRLLNNRYLGKLSLLYTEGMARELLCAAMSTADRPVELHRGSQTLSTLH